MISGIDVILFDLGNTLFYDDPRAWPKVYRRAEAALWRNSPSIRSDSRTCDHIWSGRNAAEPLLCTEGVWSSRAWHSPDLERADWHPMRRTFPTPPSRAALRAMYAVTQRNWKVERDAAPTLETLHGSGFRIGAVSNGSDHWNALELLDRARLQGYFELVLTSAADGRRKPDPSIFRAALEHFHVEPSRVVMIGDSYEADILGAGNLGIRTIWITRRVSPTSAPVTTEPDATLPTLSGVPALLAQPGAA